MKKTYEDLNINDQAINGTIRAGLKRALDISLKVENDYVLQIRNQLFHSAIHYNDLCRPNSVRNGVTNNDRVVAESKMTSLATNLIEKIESLRIEENRAILEAEKSVLETKNFWITVSASLVAACIPILYSHYAGNSEVNEIKTRLV